MAADGLLAVFMANRTALVRFLRARGAGDEAEDIAQDLWMKVAAGGQGPIADPLAYLYRMADNLLVDRHRAGTRRRIREEAWEADAGADAHGAADVPSAERRLLSRERLDAVERRLSALGTRTRAIFLSFRVDGLGQRQIAAKQGISLSAVEKHLRKAYRSLAAFRVEEDEESVATERLDIGGSGDGEG